MSIYLYTAIPRDCEMRPIVRPRGRRILNGAKKTLNMLAWRAGFEADFHYSTYEDFSGCNVGDQAIALALREKLEASFAEEIVEVAWGSLDEQTVRSVNRDGSMFVISAGAYLHFDANGDLWPRLGQDMEQFRRMDCPIVSYGMGLSHKLSEMLHDREEMSAGSLHLLREFVRTLAICSVRDERSRRLLERAGTDKPLYVVPDPALFIDYGRPRSGARTREETAIGLNFAFHGTHVSNLLISHSRTYVDFAASALRRYPHARLYYMVHSDSERLVVDLLRARGVEVKVVTGGPRDLLPYYRQLAVHVGQMMHACVLALGEGIPVINLEYDTKSRQLMRDFDLEQYCVAVREYSVERLLSLLESAIEQREYLAAAIEQRLSSLWKCDKEFLQRLETVHGLRTNRKSAIGQSLA